MSSFKKNKFLSELNADSVCKIVSRFENLGGRVTDAVIVACAAILIPNRSCNVWLPAIVAVYDILKSLDHKNRSA